MTYNPDAETQLRLWVDGEEVLFPEGSALFVSSSIGLIEGAVQRRRTVNGALRVYKDPAFHKLRLTLSCQAQIAPALFNLDPEAEVVVWSPQVVRERGSTPSRPAVEGSVLVDGGVVEYRPILTGYIVSDDPLDDTEWQSTAGWSLTIEEA